MRTTSFRQVDLISFLSSHLGLSRFLLLTDTPERVVMTNHHDLPRR
jgi:hypothetical protein